MSQLIKLDPVKMNRFGNALPYGAFKKIEKSLGKGFHEVRNTFKTIKEEYDLEIVEKAIEIYNSRSVTGMMSLEDLK